MGAERGAAGGSASSGPAGAAAAWLWSDSLAAGVGTVAGSAVEVRFHGRGPRSADRGEELAAVVPPGVAAAWARQVHSATVLEVSAAGLAGEGDALLTRAPDLALAVVTADCVPILLAAGDRVAAVHAGWRGIVAGVVAATARRLASAGAPAPAAWTAWIGPAIGGCCYEVGAEVADRVAAATTAAAVLARPGAERPHLDLARAVTAQLETCGVGTIRPLVSCTRCDERLWSYRRDGEAAGRNVALIWRRAGTEGMANGE